MPEQPDGAVALAVDECVEHDACAAARPIGHRSIGHRPTLGAAAVLVVLALGLLAWRVGNKANMEKQRRAAATILQAAARGFLARRLYSAMLMAVATQIIQLYTRGMLARRKAAERRAFFDAWWRHLPHRAACRVQTISCVATSCENTEHLLPHPMGRPFYTPPLCGYRRRSPWRTNG